jgi:formate dehydrogenase subunit gamma
MGRNEAGLLPDARADWDEAAAREVIAAHVHLEGAMLPILHALQERFGYIDARNQPLIAAALNVSRAEVHGVVTFYHDFKTAPAGRHVVKLCRAEACQSMGGDQLAEHLAREHGLAMGDTTPDGRLSIEAVYCLGNCALSPAALVDGDLVGRLDAGRLDALVHDLSGGRA